MGYELDDNDVAVVEGRRPASAGPVPPDRPLQVNDPTLWGWVKHDIATPFVQGLRDDINTVSDPLMGTKEQTRQANALYKEEHPGIFPAVMRGAGQMAGSLPLILGLEAAAPALVPAAVAARGARMFAPVARSAPIAAPLTGAALKAGAENALMAGMASSANPDVPVGDQMLEAGLWGGGARGVLGAAGGVGGAAGRGAAQAARALENKFGISLPVGKFADSGIAKWGSSVIQNLPLSGAAGKAEANAGKITNKLLGEVGLTGDTLDVAAISARRAAVGQELEATARQGAVHVGPRSSFIDKYELLKKKGKLNSASGLVKEIDDAIAAAQERAGPFRNMLTGDEYGDIMHTLVGPGGLRVPSEISTMATRDKGVKALKAAMEEAWENTTLRSPGGATLVTDFTHYKNMVPKIKLLDELAQGVDKYGRPTLTASGRPTAEAYKKVLSKTYPKGRAAAQNAQEFEEAARAYEAAEFKNNLFKRMPSYLPSMVSVGAGGNLLYNLAQDSSAKTSNTTYNKMLAGLTALGAAGATGRMMSPLVKEALVRGPMLSPARAAALDAAAARAARYGTQPFVEGIQPSND